MTPLFLSVDTQYPQTPLPVASGANNLNLKWITPKTIYNINYFYFKKLNLKSYF